MSLRTIWKRGWEEKTEMTKHSLARPNQVETSKLMRPCKVDRNASFTVTVVLDTEKPTSLLVIVND